MKFKTTTLACSLVLVLGMVALPQVQAQSSPTPQTAGAGAYEPKGALLLFLAPTLKDAVIRIFEGFLRGWSQPISDKINYAKLDASGKEQNPQASNGSAGNPAVTQPAVSASPPEAPLQAPLVAPSASDSGNQAQVLPTIAARIVKVDKQGNRLGALPPLQNTMVTGDRFVLEYFSPMPGLVLTQNRDGAQKIELLDTNQVGPMVNNYVPQNGVSYELQGEPGIETFRLLFLPCTSADSAGQGANASMADLSQVVATATQKGAAFGPKGIGKTNDTMAANAASVLTPTAMKSLSGCDKARLDAAAGQAFNAFGSKAGSLDGVNSLAQGQQPGQIVELLLTINHKSPGL
jgi:hypothetical protein